MKPTNDPNRTERLLLVAAALRGTLTGAAHAITSWLLNHLTH